MRKCVCLPPGYLQEIKKLKYTWARPRLSVLRWRRCLKGGGGLTIPNSSTWRGRAFRCKSSLRCGLSTTIPRANTKQPTTKQPCHCAAFTANIKQHKSQSNLPLCISVFGCFAHLLKWVVICFQSKTSHKQVDVFDSQVPL